MAQAKDRQRVWIRSFFVFLFTGATECRHRDDHGVSEYLHSTVEPAAPLLGETKGTGC